MTKVHVQKLAIIYDNLNLKYVFYNNSNNINFLHFSSQESILLYKLVQKIKLLIHYGEH